MGPSPSGVTAGPNGVITFTDYGDNAEALWLLQPGTTTPTHVSFVWNNNFQAHFAVDSAREVAVTPDGKYAFVVGYDVPNFNLPSGNHGVPSFDPAGSNIGIVADPFTNPTLVAATRSIPDGFPYDVAVSPDGKYLYATFAGIPVAGGEGAIMVYNINQIIATLQTASSSELQDIGIDTINPLIDTDANYQLPPSAAVYNPILINSFSPSFEPVNPKQGDDSPIGTGGIPHGMAVQSNTLW